MLTAEFISKLTRSIRDAILTCPMFTAKVDEIAKKKDDDIIAEICKQFGIEKLSDLRLKDEVAANELPGKISGEIDIKLREPATAKLLVDLIAANPVALEILQKAIHDEGNKVKKTIGEKRIATLQDDIRGFYATRNPDSEPPSFDDIKPMAEYMDKTGVVRGLKFHEFPAAVTAWIEAREEEMGAMIRSVAYANTKDEDIAIEARLLIMEGVPIEEAAVRERLTTEPIRLKK